MQRNLWNICENCFELSLTFSLAEIRCQFVGIAISTHSRMFGVDWPSLVTFFGWEKYIERQTKIVMRLESIQLSCGTSSR
jgi:hypothetical protein